MWSLFRSPDFITKTQSDNMFFSCEHFSVSVDDLMSHKFSNRYVQKLCLSMSYESSYSQVIRVLESLRPPMLKRNVLFVPGSVNIFSVQKH